MAETRKHKLFARSDPRKANAALVGIAVMLVGAALQCGQGAVLPTSTAALAAEGYYVCEILNTYDLERDGSLGGSPWATDFHGKHFIVSRADGQITGSVVPTLMAQRTEVLSYGDSSNSFRAIAHFSSSAAGRDIQVLYVHEFVPGTHKPFIASSMGGAGIVTGTCE